MNEHLRREAIIAEGLGPISFIVAVVAVTRGMEVGWTLIGAVITLLALLGTGVGAFTWWRETTTRDDEKGPPSGR